MKSCSKCRKAKPTSEFTRNRTRKDGFQGQCRDCISVYRDEHREEITTYRAKYLSEHSEQSAASAAKYHAEHSAENIRPSHASCNQSKGSKILAAA